MSDLEDPAWLKARIDTLTATMQQVPADERGPFEDTIAALRRALVRTAMNRDS